MDGQQGWDGSLGGQHLQHQQQLQQEQQDQSGESGHRFASVLGGMIGGSLHRQNSGNFPRQNSGGSQFGMSGGSGNLHGQNGGNSQSGMSGGSANIHRQRSGSFHRQNSGMSGGGSASGDDKEGEAVFEAWDMDEGACPCPLDNLLSYFLSSDANNTGTAKNNSSTAGVPATEPASLGMRSTFGQPHSQATLPQPSVSQGPPSSPKVSFSPSLAGNSSSGSLGRGGNNGSGIPAPSALRASTRTAGGTGGAVQSPVGPRPFMSNGVMVGGGSASGGVEMGRDREPPVTPAIQFYGSSSSSRSQHGTLSHDHSNHRKRGLSSSQATSSTPVSMAGVPLPSPPPRIDSFSSSNSSLSSMAAAMALGGGSSAVMQLQSQLQSKGKTTPPSHGASPISPAEMIGIGHEQMMLPPPPRFPGSQPQLKRQSPSPPIQPSNSATQMTTQIQSITHSSQPQIQPLSNPGQQHAAMQVHPISWQGQGHGHGHGQAQQPTIQHQPGGPGAPQNQDQQHLEWIQQVNSLAAMTGQSTSALGHGHVLPQPPTLPQQQHEQKEQPTCDQEQQTQEYVHAAMPMNGGYQKQQTTGVAGAFPPETLQIPPNPPHRQQQQAAAMGVTMPAAPISTQQLPMAPSDVLPSAAVASAILSNPRHLAPRGGSASGGGTAVESAERRARRLARNRESARQSRRRKKEHLASLSEKVNKLHNAIENERRSQLASMEGGLTSQRESLVSNLICEMAQDGGCSNENSAESLAQLLRSTGPNCPPRRAAVAFQYTILRQLLLPKYQEFLLWNTLNPISYFTAGKEERSKVTKISARVSSKQIGEDLTMMWKSGKGFATGGTGHGKALPARAAPSMSSSTSGKRGSTAEPASQESGSGSSNLSTDAYNAKIFWPLFCFEMSLSVDQEERFIQAHRKSQQIPNLPKDRSQIAVATTMAKNIRTGLLFQCHTAEHRNEMSLLHILTPAQSVTFLSWAMANKERCRSVLLKKRRRGSEGTEDDSFATLTASLNILCKRLDEALKLKKHDSG